MKKSTFLLAALLCGAWCATAQTTEKGHEYVDLGLPSGLKWATCNVGATTPEKYGKHFAWGETEPRTIYDGNTYKWGTATYDEEYEWWDLETLTKYNTSSDYGTVDDKTVLDLADDAARVNWGGQWRMPTDDEWTELRENCTWTWTTLNGVNGYEVKGANGNSIFLPAAGGRELVDLNGVGGDGSYWSSSLDADYPSDAWYVYFLSGNVGRNGLYRYYGFSVRAVCE
ncbi:MAG: hypothetical protein PUK04_00040 [Bacteroidales bacterium]|nr:hypothetical protein [Bacteroidales bacterium]MDY6036048.1 hypothetical protein [Paludibacteraceae bacterium]